MALDPRIVRVTFEDGVFTDVFETEAIKIKGNRTASWVQNEAEISIANIDKETRDRLATKYRPENQLRVGATRGFVFVDVGRVSTGLHRLFEGNIVLIGVTDPPDIQMVVTVVANYFSKSDLTSKNFGPINKISGIAQSISEDLGVELDFRVSDERNINVSNLYYSGDMAGQMRVFDQFPFIDAFIDNGRLVVVDSQEPSGDFVVEINSSEEMIGIPTFSDVGINVKILIRPNVRVGSVIRITSSIYPAANGDYVIVNLGFDVATRDTPFYYDIFATRRI